MQFVSIVDNVSKCIQMRCLQYSVWEMKWKYLKIGIFYKRKSLPYVD